MCYAMPIGGVILFDIISGVDHAEKLTPMAEWSYG